MFLIFVQWSVFIFCSPLRILFKLNNESGSNLKAQQMCIISCSLWKWKRVDIEHWSLKLQFCCSIIHDTTEWYILARGPCGQQPPVRAASPSVLCCCSYNCECKCFVNGRDLWENLQWYNMCNDSFWMNCTVNWFTKGGIISSAMQQTITLATSCAWTYGH